MRSIIFTSGPLCKPGPRYIDVIPNFELECELQGLAEGLKIISPNNIVRQIRRKAKLIHELYSGGVNK